MLLLLIFSFLLLEVKSFVVRHKAREVLQENEGTLTFSYELLLQYSQQGVSSGILSSLQKVCKHEGVAFDPYKLELEVQTCVADPVQELIETMMSISANQKQLAKFAAYKISHGITDFISLTNLEQEVLKTRIILPLCTFMIENLRCLRPKEIPVVSECIKDAHEKTIDYTVQAIHSVCHNNGSRIIEFLNLGGYGCLESYGNKFNEYFTYEDTKLESNGLATMDELCKWLNNMHHEFIPEVLKTCTNQSPVPVINSVLLDMQNWTLNTCADVKVTGQGVTLKLTKTSITIFTFFITILQNC